MQIISACDARRQFSTLLDIARKEPVAITRYNRPTAYLVSPAEFREMRKLRRKSQLDKMTRMVASLEAAGHSAAPRLYRELGKLTKQVEAE